MNTIDVEKLNQLISRTDISGNDKVRWLTDFIDGREFEQQERSYSEEEVLKLVEDFEIHLGSVKIENMLTFKKWFDRNKNK